MKLRPRLLTILLVAVLVALQAQLWFGRGSIPNVSRLQDQVQDQKQRNQDAQLRNQRLEAEVRDLQEGLDMVEEKARTELGMVRLNEIYVHLGAHASNARAASRHAPAVSAAR